MAKEQGKALVTVEGAECGLEPSVKPLAGEGIGNHRCLLLPRLAHCSEHITVRLEPAVDRPDQIASSARH